MQIDRLFEILYILLERQTISARELAQHLEVSTKTIYRDVERLSRGGIPLYTNKGRGGGISVLSDFVMDKAMLNADEKRDILSAMRAFAIVNPNSKKSSNSRLNAFLGSTEADWIEVDFSAWSSGEKEKALFKELKRCILEQQVVCFFYANGRGERLERTVEPLKLGYKGEAWYLYGYCRLREDFRFFKLNRITNLTVLREKCQRTPPARIFPERKIFDETFVRLKMKLSPRVMYRAYEEFEQVELLSDGGGIVEALYPEGPWLYSYILSYGEDCEVLEPESLRRHYQELLKKMLGKYSEKK